MNHDVLILSRSDVAAHLPMSDCIAAVESAFRTEATGGVVGPGVLSMHVPGGGFHIKAAGIGTYFVTKVNGNFFDNESRGLPRIQGAIILSDATNGRPLAILDSIEITIRRTAAATAVATKHLARRGATTATIIGCGNQGRASVEALRAVMPLERIYAYDVDEARARSLAASHDVVLADRYSDAIAASDICITTTPSRTAYVQREHVHPGLFIAAVGADSDQKQEIAVDVLAASRVVVDHLGQCASIGDLHHAIAAGVMQEGDVVAILGEVIAGRRPGRTSDDDIVIFDSTGTALQDVAAAAIVYERCVRDGGGLRVMLS